MREISPLSGNVCPKCMLFEIRMARSSPYASISGRNRAIQDTWRANLAAKAPFRVERPEIMHGAKKLPALPGFSAAADRTVWPNGLCALWSMLGSLAACADPLPLELVKCGEAQIERDAGVRPVQKRRERWAKAINGSGLPHAADNRPTNRASLAANCASEALLLCALCPDEKTVPVPIFPLTP